MRTNCIRCRIEYDTTKGYCKTCYERVIFKGQCLNLAEGMLRGKYSPEHPSFFEKLFNVTRQIFEEGTGEKIDSKKKFLEW